MEKPDADTLTCVAKFLIARRTYRFVNPNNEYAGQMSVRENDAAYDVAIVNTKSNVESLQSKSKHQCVIS